DIDKIVDNNADTKYTANYNKVWIVWKGNSAVNVEEYHLTSTSSDQKYDPKSWTLSASNDSVTWTILDTKNDFVFTERKSKKKFSINDKTPYLYFKLDITANNGGDLTQMAEWGLKKPISMEDLMRFASGFSASSQTTMGKHYENRHVTTDSDITWLLDPNNEPPAPGSLNNSAEWKELPVTLYPFGEPVPADINQHDIGDCGGIAALASMAYLYPDFIKSIIKDNGDKTYTIDMFDPQGKAVKLTVSSTFLVRKDNKRIAAVSSKSDKACWSTIFEKAIMKYNVIYKVNPDIGGIGSEHVPPLFTGDGGSFAFSPGVLNNEQLKRAVEASLDEGKLVIGGFNQAVQFGNTKTVTGHAFTFMYSTDSSALFTMRNPWGFNPNTDGKDDGVLHIPDNGYIPPLIDLRIVNPGKAINMKKDIEPYIPPVFSSVTHELRVNPALMASGM
ncbi:MAG: C2 family cysteine protease, partial [Dysgonamonadaceae bacterium]